MLQESDCLVAPNWIYVDLKKLRPLLVGESAPLGFVAHDHTHHGSDDPQDYDQEDEDITANFKTEEQVARDYELGLFAAARDRPTAGRQPIIDVEVFNQLMKQGKGLCTFRVPQMHTQLHDPSQEGSDRRDSNSVLTDE